MDKRVRNRVRGRQGRLTTRDAGKRRINGLYGFWYITLRVLSGVVSGSQASLVLIGFCFCCCVR